MCRLSVRAVRVGLARRPAPRVNNSKMSKFHKFTKFKLKKSCTSPRRGPGGPPSAASSLEAAKRSEPARSTRCSLALVSPSATWVRERHNRSLSLSRAFRYASGSDERALESHERSVRFQARRGFPRVSTRASRPLSRTDSELHIETRAARGT